MENYSKGGMVAFAEMMTSKGWINTNTGSGLKAALNKILGDLADDTDVRQIDVKTQVRQYNNLHPGELSPSSLKQYEKRTHLMIGYYTKWKEDPTNFKPPAREVGDKTDKNGKPKPVVKNGKATTKSVSASWDIVANLDGAEPNGNGTAHPIATALPAPNPIVSLTMPFPLRDDYLAQITIPRDMTKDEAGRLCTFIQALARA